MKTIKPQKLSLLHRTFEARGRVDLCVTAMLACPFDAPESPLHEASLWKMLTAELGHQVAPDVGMPKPRPEVLVIGQAHPPGGPEPACSVRLRIGPIDKLLQVSGDRTWDASGAASQPAPFTAMPLTWANAFGGPEHAANPAGKGHHQGDAEGRLLPNIESPWHLVRSPGDRPEAAGFAPLPQTAPQRASKAGTYDDAWLKEQAPGLPLDFDFAFYNTAPLDQQLDEPFTGGEVFRLENVHPEQPVLEGRLPRFRSRIFVSLKGGELREIPMRLETVQLFPGARRVLILFRGVTAVADEEASDVLQLVAACEELNAPRPVDHYRAVLAERLDKKRGALAALRDGDLMPPGPAAKVSLDEIVDPDMATPFEYLKRKNMRRQTASAIEAVRARIKAAGLDPDEHLPPAPPPEPQTPTLDEIERAVTQAKEGREKLRAQASEKRAEAEARARAEARAIGIDYDERLAEQQRHQGGPPTFSAEAEMKRLHDTVDRARRAGTPIPAVEAQIADPELRRKLQATEDGLRGTYRKHAHRLPAAPAAAAEVTDQARAELEAGALEGVSFAGRDLTGADLSGLDLHGVDLSSALLEGALLRGTNLAGADLTGAVLARADLTGADLAGARLAGCNLGRALLVEARVTGGVDLTGAVLAGADLSGASFRGARLHRVDLGEAVFRDTDFSEIVGTHLTFMKSDLRGAKLSGASLVKCTFVDVDLRGVDLAGADLTSAVLVHVDADGAVLRGATLTKLCMVQESSCAGADLAGARLAGANLRGTKLAGCDLSGAELDGADLSGCDLRGARFDLAVGREARFTKADLSLASLVEANLMFALLDRAKVHGATFLGANLFRANLARMDADDATVMEEANLTQARILPARRPHGSS